MSAGSGTVRNRACHSLSARKPARISSGALQSEAVPSEPRTRTRRLPRSRGSSDSNGQATSTESAPSTWATAAASPRRHSMSAPCWVQPEAVVSVFQDSRGRLVPTYGESVRYSARTP